MRIAFYAPLKPPDHPVPSGDRGMARLLMAALGRGGHQVALASRLQSREGAGDPRRQERIERLGVQLRERYLRRVERGSVMRPDLWFTYHCYYKAPDHLGPAISAALGIPYAIAEASLAWKRAQGPWRRGHEATLRALAAADCVIGLNPADRAGVVPALGTPERWVPLKPFLDEAPYLKARAVRETTRADLAQQYDLDPEIPWIAVAAMMRPDVKRNSYRLLGAALAGCCERPFALLVAGDGPARDDVTAALAPLGGRVRFLGALGQDVLPLMLAASDLYAWPSIGEAWGMALLEAQAAGLPAVAGATGGVGDIVAHGVSGTLVPVGDTARFAAAVAALLDDPAERRRLGQGARDKVAAEHGLEAAAKRLDATLRALAPERVR